MVGIHIQKMNERNGTKWLDLEFNMISSLKWRVTFTHVDLISKYIDTDVWCVHMCFCVCMCTS